MPQTSGREAQRRRTRRAILDATSHLLAAGTVPSLNEIAAAADVARRTVYLHFPTIEQVILDAIVGMTSTGVDEALAAAPVDDARARVRVLVQSVAAGMHDSLPLGRQLIKITVDRPADDSTGPRRGYRRVEWIESALEPVRVRLGPEPFERLVSALAVVTGWEAYVVLVDVRGLDHRGACDVVLTSALALFDAALATAPSTG